MKSNELRNLSIEELKERVKSETMKLEKMKLTHKITPLDKPSTITDQRKFVARINTILREKELEVVNQK